jgi:ABC-type transport system substrate-binding protein
VPALPPRAIESLFFQGVGLDSLHPYAYSGGGISGIWQHVIEPLIEMDFSRKEYVGVLAESWQFQGRKWTFHLRKNVRFHDGSALTSKDVLFSIVTDWIEKFEKLPQQAPLFEPRSEPLRQELSIYFSCELEEKKKKGKKKK